MKVALEKDYKKYYTLEDLRRAKAVIASMKDDESTIAEYAEMAVNEVFKDAYGHCIDVLKATAETSRNCRAWNVYDTDSEDMDVIIHATAETSEGFIKITAYLSDIWQTGATDYRNAMFIQRFQEKR